MREGPPVGPAFSVNGTALTDEQCVAVRVALVLLSAQLADEAFRVDVGHKLADDYLARLREVFGLMHTPWKAGWAS